MTSKKDDCYFYYYSTCNKGTTCPFRHCAEALGSEQVCNMWKDGKCERQGCSYRHMNIKRDRKNTPCFYENQPQGCLKPHCPFLHILPRLGMPPPDGATSGPAASTSKHKASWKRNSFRRGMNVAMKRKHRKQQEKILPKVKPYNPKTGKDCVVVYCELCEDWDTDGILEDKFTFDSGEEITIKKWEKFFDLEKEHYISMTRTYVDGKLIGNSVKLKEGNGSSHCQGKECDRSDWALQLSRRINQYRGEKERMNAVLPILEEVFTPGYNFLNVKSDPAFNIIIRDKVSFGDFVDAQKEKSQNEEVTGTIVGFVNTVRPFLPGIYLTTVIKMYDDCDPVVIFHHKDIDPQKIAWKIIVMSEDFCHFYKDMNNSINRYDWCHFRNWSFEEEESEEEFEEHPSFSWSEEEEPVFLTEEDAEDYYEKRKELFDKKRQEAYEERDRRRAERKKEYEKNIHLDKVRNVIYFADTTKSSQLKNAVNCGFVQQSTEIPELYQVLDSDLNCISLAIDVYKYNSLGFIYGKAFQDELTGKYFALIVNFYMGELDSHYGDIPLMAKEKFPDQKFTSLKETNLNFNIDEFRNDVQ